MAKEINVIKRGQQNFTLIGKAKLGQYSFKIDEKSKKSSYIYSQANLTLKTKEGEISASVMGGYNPERDNVIYAFTKGNKDNKGQSIVVSWEDRFDEEIIETVADMKLFKAGVSKKEDGSIEYVKFLHPYDFINHLEQHMVDGEVYVVRGELQYQEYNGELKINKNITSVALAKEEIANDPEAHEAKFSTTILTDNNFLGKPDKETMTVPVDAHVIDFFNEYHKQEIVRMVNGKEKNGLTMPVPMSFDFKIAKDMETTKKLLKYLKPKRGAVTEIVMEGIFSKSQGELKGEELTIDDLDDDIKFMVEIGAYTLEEALGKVNFVYGEKTPEKMLLTRPAIKKVEGKDGSSTLIVNYTPDKYNEEDLVIENILKVNNAKFKTNEEDEEEDIFNEEETEDNDDLDLDDDWSDIF